MATSAAAGGAASVAAAMAGPKPRLMILKMVLENFKSYGGVKEIGPFHKSFSSVVGPNGSGKSNVIDAMLFVFGKKATKMRLKNMAELIHKSAEYPELDFCRVSVYFQDIIDDTASEDAYAVVPGSQFVVTRTAHRNNTSKYYVDGKGSSFTEVTSLLKGRGIDLDNNRFLILQGEVEQISMMKPKAGAPGEEGLLEYLEDIIGSNVYVTRIEESEKVVESLTGDRGTHLARVKAAEREVTVLEGAKAEAQALLRKERELARQQGAMCQKVLFDTDAAAASVKTKHDAAAARLAAAKEALASHTAAMAEINSRLAAASKAHADASAAVAAANEARSSAEREDAKAREHIAATIRGLKKAEEGARKNIEALAEARATRARLAESLPGLQAEVTRLEGERDKEAAAYEGVLASLKGETEGLRAAMEAKQAELTPASEAAASAQADLMTRRTELRLLKERAEAAAKESAGLAAQVAKLTADRDAKAAELASAKEEQAAATARKAALDASSAALAAAEASALAALRKARDRLDEYKAALAAEGASAPTSASSSGAGAAGGAASGGGGGGGRTTSIDAAITAACKKGGPLQGVRFHGRLGDLGTIDAKYDAAITTACAALSYLVVDTDADGTACVEFLRARNLGRAKFIMLDKVGWVSSRMAASFTAPEGVPRLFDLVKPKDDALRPAFYFALRDTLAAADMDQAMRVAYSGEGGRIAHRVVTLAGELIDTSGTMSGGGRAVRKGGMASAAAGTSSVSAEEYAAAEKDAEAATAAHTEAKARRGAVTAEVRDLERSLPKLATRIAKLEMEAASLAKQVEEVAARATAAAASASSSGPSADDRKAIAEVTAQVADLEMVHAKASEASRRLEGEVSKLQKAILEAGGEKVKRGKARLDRANEALDAATRAVTACAAEGKAAEKACEKATAAIEEAKVEIGEGKARYEELKGTLEAFVTRFNEAKAAGDEAADAAKAAEKTLFAVKGEATKAERDSREARDEEREAAAATDTCAVELGGLKKKREAWAAKLAAFTDDYAARIAEAVADKAADMALAGEGEEEAEAAATGASTAAGSAGAASDAATSHRKGRDSAAGGAASGGDSEDEDGDDAMAGSAAGGKGAGKKGKGKAAGAPPAASAAATALGEPLTMPVLSDTVLKGLRVDDIQAGIGVLEGEKDALLKKANIQAIAEYRAKHREYLRRVAELDAITTARDGARRTWESLRKKRLDEFMAGFSVISLRLKEMYQMITLGGDAELELVDTCDPFAEGILFQVRPPKKSWKNISNLSGGEKTLSSLALVFALHHYKPTPLYVMDEIDAALDFKNVSIVGNYIKERTKDAQFVIISLRNNMFELADRLVGIYKTADVTKSITINPKKIAADCLPPDAGAASASSSAASAAPVASAASGGGDEDAAVPALAQGKAAASGAAASAAVASAARAAAGGTTSAGL